MTRAAIAAADRKSKENIANKDRQSREKIEGRKADIEAYRAKHERVFGAARATKDIVGSIGAAKTWNHPEWYKKFGSDKYTAQLPTFNRIGLETYPHFLSDNNQTTSTVWGGQRTVPGIMVIKYLPTLPNQAKSATGYKDSPINVGLARFMSELRKMNSRIGDYDPSDFGLYWYAGADYLYLIERTRTAIEAYNTYHIDNAYFADALISALGFDSSNFKAHIAEYKYLVDKHINTFNSSIVLPVNLTFIQRRAWLAKTVVKDHKSSVSQLYVFRQRRLGWLTDDENTLQFGSTEREEMTFANVQSMLDTMLQQLTNSVGMQTMMADLRAGIPANKFVQLAPLDASAEIVITEGDFDLEQIHNLKTIPVEMNAGTSEFNEMPLSQAVNLNIHAMSDGFLAQGVPNSARTQLTTPGPLFSYGHVDASIVSAYLSYRSDGFLNFYDEEAGNDDILEATRLRCHVLLDTDNDTAYANIRGTELVTSLCIYVYTYQKELKSITLGTEVFVPSTADAEGESCALLSRFDWCPVVRFIDWKVNADDEYVYQGFYTVGELDKIVLCNKDNLSLLHEQCCLSLFYIDSGEFLKAR